MLHLILIGAFAVFLIGRSIDAYLDLHGKDLGIEQSIIAICFGVGVFALTSIAANFTKWPGLIELGPKGIFFLGFLWLSMLNSLAMCYYIKKVHSLRWESKKGSTSC